MNRVTRAGCGVQRSDGFGIIEILVSMLLLALLALAFLPLLIQSLQVSVSNSTLATATQLVAQQMEELRAMSPVCDTLDAFTPAEHAETGLTVAVSVSCPKATEAQLARVVITASNIETGLVVSEATTLIYVTS